MGPECSWLQEHRSALENRKGVKPAFRKSMLFLDFVFERAILRPVFHMPLDGLMPYLSLCIEKKAFRPKGPIEERLIRP